MSVSGRAPIGGPNHAKPQSCSLTCRGRRGWPIQAVLWLEWGSFVAGQSLPPTRSRFRAVHSHSISTLPAATSRILAEAAPLPVLCTCSITIDTKVEAAAHPLQPCFENLPGDGGVEQAMAMVTAEGHEVSLSGRVESFQSPRHKASLCLRTSPLKPKDGLSGPPVRAALFVSQFGTHSAARRTSLLIDSFIFAIIGRYLLSIR